MTERPDRQTSWLDRRGNAAKLVWAMAGVCAVLLGLEVFSDHTGPFAIKRLFGFYAVFGFIASIVLVLLVRWAAPVVRRREDYYDA